MLREEEDAPEVELGEELPVEEAPPEAALDVFAVPRQLLSLELKIVAPPDVFD